MAVTNSFVKSFTCRKINEQSYYQTGIEITVDEKQSKMVYQYLNLSTYHLPTHLSICHLHVFQMFRKGKTLVSCKSGLNELGITVDNLILSRENV